MIGEHNLYLQMPDRRTTEVVHKDGGGYYLRYKRAENYQPWRINEEENYPPKDYQDYPNRRISPRQRNCLHDSCYECHGTGRRRDGGICVHMISCPCERCNPYTM